MGIPSYYRKLLDKLPHLVSRSHPDPAIQWLFMDFNCLIYHTLHRADTPVYDGSDEWESQFIECIIHYTRKIIREVAPEQGVFLAIDGVVPMAKMRQQRLRRFKSVWMKTGESVSWDTNAITPGTAFMGKLRIGLEKMIRNHGTWILSSSDEPGEGEHKIMAAWRKGQYSGNFAIYGLDADLIVLSLLNQTLCSLDNQIWLFREEMEKGAIAYDADGEEQMEWFSMNTLRDWLSTEYSSDPAITRQFILNYACAMSVLGNDFLPSSLGLKMREDGHTELLRLLPLLSCPLVDPNTLDLSLSGLQSFFGLLFQQEGKRIQTFISKKQWQGSSFSALPVGDPNWPLSTVVEAVLMEGKQLASHWKTTYLTHFFSGASKEQIGSDYLYGIQWIWAYYTGNMEQVCFNWYYPHALPPLWEWIRESALPSVTVRIRAEQIRPTEQLALVLPLESWHLIPPCKEKQFPLRAPYCYPSEFSFESIGKRYFWECEALIPVPSICELQALLR